MPWDNGNANLVREEFVGLAIQPRASISQLCKKFKISRKTGYKWIHRKQEHPLVNFEDRPKRPHHIISVISDTVKEKIIVTRCLYPHWVLKKSKLICLTET